jgi:MFS family permease
MDRSMRALHCRPGSLSGAPPWPSRQRAIYVIGVLFVLTLLSQLDRQLPALVVRPLRKEFGLSDTGFSLLQGYAFAAFYTLAGLPLGRLVDRGNRRNIICCGLLTWSTSTALFAFGHGYTQLLVARMGVGIGEAVLAPAAYSMIADHVMPSRRGRALAAYYVSIAIGSGASLLLGGWLLSVIPAQGLEIGSLGLLPPWRVAFLAAALPALPLAVLLMLSVREPARRDDHFADATGTAPSLRDFVGHLRTHAATFSRTLFYPALLSIIGYGALAWAPALFDRRFGMPPSTSGVILGLIVAGAGASGTLLSGTLSDAWIAKNVHAARLRVALVGLSLATLPAIAWPLMPTPTLSFALLFLTVLGLALAQSAAPAAIQDVVPNRMRGQAIAVYLLLAGLLGIGLGPTTVALVTDRLFNDDHALPWSLAVTAAPAALFGLWILGTGLRPYATTMRQLHDRAQSREDRS